MIFLAKNTYFHTHQTIAYVAAEFGIRYTVAGMNQWLHHNQFSYKKSKGVPHKFNAEQQRVAVLTLILSNTHIGKTPEFYENSKQILNAVISTRVSLAASPSWPVDW